MWSLCIGRGQKLFYNNGQAQSHYCHYIPTLCETELETVPKISFYVGKYVHMFTVFGSMLVNIQYLVCANLGTSHEISMGASEVRTVAFHFFQVQNYFFKFRLQDFFL